MECPLSGQGGWDDRSGVIVSIGWPSFSPETGGAKTARPIATSPQLHPAERGVGPSQVLCTRLAALAARSPATRPPRASVRRRAAPRRGGVHGCHRCRWEGARVATRWSSPPRGGVRMAGGRGGRAGRRAGGRRLAAASRRAAAAACRQRGGRGGAGSHYRRHGGSEDPRRAGPCRQCGCHGRGRRQWRRRGRRRGGGGEAAAVQVAWPLLPIGASPLLSTPNRDPHTPPTHIHTHSHIHPLAAATGASPPPPPPPWLSSCSSWPPPPLP